MEIVDISAWAITSILFWETFKLVVKALKDKRPKITVEKEFDDKWHSDDVY